MRALAAHAYERTGGGELWTELPCSVQDYLTRLVAEAIELHEGELACSNCGGPIEAPTCAECWLRSSGVPDDVIVRLCQLLEASS